MDRRPKGTSKWDGQSIGYLPDDRVVGTPMYIRENVEAPITLEYATSCVEIVEYIMHVKKCGIDEVLVKIGMSK